MSTAAHPGQSPAIGLHHSPGYLPPALVLLARRPVSRRPSYSQGRALEVLGHAIEYLVDSRMFLVDEPATRADSEATQMLMLHSRQIFAECAEVMPPIRRLKLWIAERLSVSASC